MIASNRGLGLRSRALTKGLAALLIAAAFAAPAFADENRQKPGVISISGVGKVSAAPDMALVSLGVLREAKTARQALSANNSAMAEVLAAMKQAGIEDKDLQTSGFSIQPKYHYPKRNSNGQQLPPKIVGYTVSNTLDVRIRDLGKTGEILDQAVTLGMNTGGGIRFLNQDTTGLIREARKKAMEDAIARARVLTETAGVGLGRILNIAENAHVPRPVTFKQARAIEAADAAAAVPVAGGENSYEVTVQVSWEIDQ